MGLDRLLHPSRALVRRRFCRLHASIRTIRSPPGGGLGRHRLGECPYPVARLDRNANGAVDDGSELFGSMTPLTTGGRASNGFVALAELDDDADGIISSGDSAFGHLLLWRDLDQNRLSSPNELTLASDAGLESIALANRVQPRCTATACEMQRSRFVFRDGVNRREGEVIDVYFQDR